MREIFPAILLCFIGAGAGAQAASPVEKDRSLQQSVGIPSDYVVTYVDERGQPLAPATFLQRAAHEPFSIKKNPAAHRATLQFETPEESAAAAARVEHPPMGVMIGKPFPEFSGHTLRGSIARSSDYRGKPTLINFFFAGCAPCIQETPVLAEFRQNHPEVRVLAITFDDEQTAAGFAKRYAFDWPVLFDQQALIDLAHVTMYPTMVLIGSDGIVKRASASGTIAQHGEPLTADRLGQWVKSF